MFSKWLALLALFFTALVLAQQVVVDSSGRVIIIGGKAQITSSSGAPAAPTEVIGTQGGGPSICNVSGGSGCLTNTAILTWTASSGATSYKVYRNSTLLSSGGCSSLGNVLTCTDGTATNLNQVSGYGDETTYAYQVEACNSNGCSSGTYEGWWLYHGQAYNSAANYSGGGYGAYMGTTPVINTTNGSQQINVTNVGTYTIYPYNPIQDQSSQTSGGMGVIPLSTGNSALGNPYFLPYGSSCGGGATTGTGGNGTYCISMAATGTTTGDVISAEPGQYSQNGMESLPVTSGDPCGGPELGHTYEMTFNWTSSGEYVQEYTASPGSVSYDLNAADTTYSRIDVCATSLSHGLTYTIHSRPGANASNTGDIYSSRLVEVFNQSGVGSYCSGITTNAWFTCLVPNTVLGIGTGTFTGYVTANWHGTLTNNGTSATLVSTTDGLYSNIVNGDYVMVHESGGWQCIQATSTPASSTGSFTYTTCPSGGAYTTATPIEATDAQVCASSASVSPGPDNAGLIQGNSEPDATYFGGGIVGYTQSPGTNPNGVGTCTGTGNGHWGLFNGNGTAILTEGSSGSPLTNWTARRTSLYKPEFQQEGGSGFQTYFVDMVGWTH